MSRLGDLHDSQHDFALRVLLEVGALTNCEHHDDALFDGGEDVEEAIEHAKSLFKSDKSSVPFDNVEEMARVIRSVYTDNSFNDSCPYCDEWERD